MTWRASVTPRCQARVLGRNPSAPPKADRPTELLDGADGCRSIDTGAYRAWLDGFGADAVLIRPDFAIYGTAHGADDLTGLVDEYLTHLGHTTPASTRPSISTASG